jgi:hypothetical protein
VPTVFAMCWYDCAGQVVQAAMREEAAREAGVPVAEVRSPFPTLDRLFMERQARPWLSRGREAHRR